MKAVILAAGRSERLNPFTETRAKPMIRVAGKTILEYMMRALRDAGVTDIIIVVNHERKGIESYFEHGNEFGVEIEYVVQDSIDGIGGALSRCEKMINGDQLMLIYGDVLVTGQPFRRVIDQHTESGGAVAAISLPGNSGEFGNVYLDNDMRITRLVEKPSDPQLSNYVLAGIYLLPNKIFSLLRENGNNMEECFHKLIEEKTLFGTHWDGGWIDVRRPWQILEANRLLMSQWNHARIHASVQFQGSVQIEGPVQIEEGVVVASGSVIKGPCYIGRNSYIGNNALVREYTSIGPDSTVGYGTELKNCVLFGQTVIGRLSFIGDSVIGERVHLGTALTTVNYLAPGKPIEVHSEEGMLQTGMNKLGSFIGDDVHLGARHVLAPGTRIRSGYSAQDSITQETVL